MNSLIFSYSLSLKINFSQELPIANKF